MTEMYFCLICRNAPEIKGLLLTCQTPRAGVPKTSSTWEQRTVTVPPLLYNQDEMCIRMLECICVESDGFITVQRYDGGLNVTALTKITQ